MQVASFAGRISVGVLADRYFSPRSVLIALGLMGPLGIYVLTVLSNDFSPYLLFPAKKNAPFRERYSFYLVNIPT